MVFYPGYILDLLQKQRYSNNMIDHWQNPAHQVKALGTT